MELDNTVLWLRICYWLGAIVDGFVAIQMLLPDFWASFNDLLAHRSTPELGFALGVGASLMFGWTVLLIWADRRPVERRGVLLITVFPVIIGLMLNNAISVASGLRPLEPTLPILLVQLILVALFTLSYRNANRT